jgi:hypothetical protein
MKYFFLKDYCLIPMRIAGNMQISESGSQISIPAEEKFVLLIPLTDDFCSEFEKYLNATRQAFESSGNIPDLLSVIRMSSDRRLFSGPEVFHSSCIIVKEAKTGKVRKELDEFDECESLATVQIRLAFSGFVSCGQILNRVEIGKHGIYFFTELEMEQQKHKQVLNLVSDKITPEMLNLGGIVHTLTQ